MKSVVLWGRGTAGLSGRGLMVGIEPSVAQAAGSRRIRRRRLSWSMRWR